MVGFGKSCSAIKLEEQVKEIQLACSNNYKDMAKDAFREYKVLLEHELVHGDLKEKERPFFQQLAAEYEEVFKTYHH